MSKGKYGRWVMLKNLLAFQIKLTFDAVRDLILSPVSFVCALIDMIKNNDEQNSQFKQLMKLGEQTDIWLNLFGQHQHQSAKNSETTSAKSVSSSSPSPLEKAGQKFSNGNADQYIEKIETLFKDNSENSSQTEQEQAQPCDTAVNDKASKTE